MVIGITLALILPAVKAHRCYSAGRSLCTKHGRKYQILPRALILLSSILSATVTAFAGPISFVGIAVPFLMKRSFGTSRPLIIIPGTFLGGAVFCMMCDPDCQNGFCTSGAEYQYRYLHLWSTCCYFHDVAKEERKLKWIITIFIWITFLSVMTKRP